MLSPACTGPRVVLVSQPKGQGKGGGKGQQPLSSQTYEPAPEPPSFTEDCAMTQLDMETPPRQTQVLQPVGENSDATYQVQKKRFVYETPPRHTRTIKSPGAPCRPPQKAQDSPTKDSPTAELLAEVEAMSLAEEAPSALLALGGETSTVYSSPRASSVKGRQNSPPSFSPITRGIPLADRTPDHQRFRRMCRRGFEEEME